jgi:hypothetical protein
MLFDMYNQLLYFLFSFCIIEYYNSMYHKINSVKLDLVCCF